MTKSRFKKIVCFGEVLWDVLPTGAKPGGAPLNVAIHLNNLGLNPALISKVGQDREGSDLLSFLEKTGISTRYIQTDDTLPTSRVLIKLDEDKNATFEICEPVAWDNINYTQTIEGLCSDADTLIFGSLASRNKTSFSTLTQILQNSSLYKIMDVNLRPPYDSRDRVEKLLRLSHMAKLNDDELKTVAYWNQISGDEDTLIQWFSEFFNCPVVCVTRGANGALLYTDNKLYVHPGFKIIATDTVGAGDSFLAGLITRLTAGDSPQNALEYACATGAYVASCEGAVPKFGENEISSIIKNGPAR